MTPFRFVFLALFFFALPAHAESVRFMQSLPEIPLPAGVQENYEDATVFDTPDGRFVEVELILPNNDTNKIILYYSSLLPSLGWKKVSDVEFYKENERLKLNSSDSAIVNRITVLLEPR